MLKCFLDYTDRDLERLQFESFFPGSYKIEIGLLY